MTTSLAKKQLLEVVREYIKAPHPKTSFSSLHDYLSWLEKSVHLKIEIAGNESFERHMIDFPCSSEDEVLDCTLKEMSKLSKTLLASNSSPFEGMNWLFFPEGDLDSELEYIEMFPSALDIKWYQTPNEKEGFFYCLNSADNKLSFIASFFGGFIEEDPKFLQAVEGMETWEGLRYYKHEGGYEYVDWEDELHYSLGSEIYDFILTEMNDILNGLVVMQCCSSYGQVDDPLGPSYFIISGCNQEKGRCEGLIIGFTAR